MIVNIAVYNKYARLKILIYDFGFEQFSMTGRFCALLPWAFRGTWLVLQLPEVTEECKCMHIT